MVMIILSLVLYLANYSTKHLVWRLRNGAQCSNWLEKFNGIELFLIECRDCFGLISFALWLVQKIWELKRKFKIYITKSIKNSYVLYLHDAQNWAYADFCKVSQLAITTVPRPETLHRWYGRKKTLRSRTPPHFAPQGSVRSSWKGPKKDADRKPRWADHICRSPETDTGVRQDLQKGGEGRGGGEGDLHQHVTGIIRRPICFVITNHIFETRSEPNAPMPPQPSPPSYNYCVRRVQKFRKNEKRQTGIEGCLKRYD